MMLPIVPLTREQEETLNQKLEEWGLDVDPYKTIATHLSIGNTSPEAFIQFCDDLYQITWDAAVKDTEHADKGTGRL